MKKNEITKNKLVPFIESDYVKQFNLEANIEREDSQLVGSFRLNGPLDHIIVPTKVADAARKDGLWKNTCFEFFMRPTQTSAYLEVNLSPSGEWNVYEFDDYRKGMRESKIVKSVKVDTNFHDGCLNVSWSLKFDKDVLNKKERGYLVGITAVLEHRSGEKSYWALKHCDENPDFHNAESFSTEI